MERALQLVSELKSLETRIKIRNDELRKRSLAPLDYQFVGDLEVTERIIKKTDPFELEMYQIPQLTNKLNRARLALEKDSEDKVVGGWIVPLLALGGLVLAAWGN